MKKSNRGKLYGKVPHKRMKKYLPIARHEVIFAEVARSCDELADLFYFWKRIAFRDDGFVKV